MPKLLEQARTILALATIAFVSNSPTSIGSYWSPFHLPFILLLSRQARVTTKGSARQRLRRRKADWSFDQAQNQTFQIVCLRHSQ